MKTRINHVLTGALALSTFFVCFYAFAGDNVVAPQDFLVLVLDAIKGFGGLSWVLKISVIITILISSMKVSFLNQMLWSKLGAFKAWAAPILGLIAGILSLAQGGEITLVAVFAYISAGAGAIILHEILDSVKSLPGIGASWLWIIELISAALGKKEVK